MNIATGRGKTHIQSDYQAILVKYLRK